ncbi:hypothetical protein TNCV_2259751 [Trichonephila clavipes]|nr:hypothetical protein TNCV_2259751 [Trichonephila clavipes]
MRISHKQTLDHLEDNIRRVIADIRPQMLKKVIENWTSRLDYIRASRGSPMPEIIFKMSSDMCNYSPTNMAPVSKKGPEEILIQGPLKASYSSGKHPWVGDTLRVKFDLVRMLGY